MDFHFDRDGGVQGDGRVQMPKPGHQRHELADPRCVWFQGVIGYLASIQTIRSIAPSIWTVSRIFTAGLSVGQLPKRNTMSK